MLFRSGGRPAGKGGRRAVQMLLGFALVCLFPVGAQLAEAACGTGYILPDRNCDGDLRVVVLGDSFVTGIGDVRNSNKGGYVKRVAAKLRTIEFKAFGRPGREARQLLPIIKSTFASAADTDLLGALERADYVILDLGRNDRWYFESAAKTATHLKRIRRAITAGVAARTGTPPLVITAVLMLPNRGSQGPWVSELNELILRSDSVAAPADLRFDLVSKRLLGTDQLHPTSVGYDALAKTLVNYLTKILPGRLASLD